MHDEQQHVRKLRNGPLNYQTKQRLAGDASSTWKKYVWPGVLLGGVRHCIGMADQANSYSVTTARQLNKARVNQGRNRIAHG